MFLQESNAILVRKYVVDAIQVRMWMECILHFFVVFLFVLRPTSSYQEELLAMLHYLIISEEARPRKQPNSTQEAAEQHQRIEPGLCVWCGFESRGLMGFEVRARDGVGEEGEQVLHWTRRRHKANCRKDRRATTGRTNRLRKSIRLACGASCPPSGVKNEMRTRGYNAECEVRIRTVCPGVPLTPHGLASNMIVRKDTPIKHVKRREYTASLPGAASAHLARQEEGTVGMGKGRHRARHTPAWAVLVLILSTSPCLPSTVSPLLRRASRNGDRGQTVERSFVSLYVVSGPPKRVSVGNSGIVNVSFEARSRRRRWTKEGGIEGQGRKRRREGKRKADKERRTYQQDAGPARTQVGGAKRAIRRDGDVRMEGTGGEGGGGPIESRRTHPLRSAHAIASLDRGMLRAAYGVKAGIGSRGIWPEVRLCRASNVHQASSERRRRRNVEQPT
ncbi:hypothetical protein K438DRAFT_2049854 [Mycena galopus ATCC 62051]|nr:hypothetical protein K438DRAFT_2049854 [Mycena galopus ATCC 62051]